MGLAVVSAACCRTSRHVKTKKWAFVIGVPLAINILIYAALDRSKFQGYSGLERFPLSSWGAGSFGEVDFSRLGDEPKAYLFSVIRIFLSIVINICSVMLVLIDAVCLEVGLAKGTVASSGIVHRCHQGPSEQLLIVRSMVVTPRPRRNLKSSQQLSGACTVSRNRHGTHAVCDMVRSTQISPR